MALCNSRNKQKILEIIISDNFVWQPGHVGLIGSALFILHRSSFSFAQMRKIAQRLSATSKSKAGVDLNKSLPDSWNDVSLPGCGQRGQQVLVLAEHQHVPEAGVGQSRGGSADPEQVVAQNHGSVRWNCGSLWEGLV